MIFIVSVTWLYVNGVNKAYNDAIKFQFQQQVKMVNQE